MNAILMFTYINHKLEKHTYKVIPISIAWERSKLFPENADHEAWTMRALVLERSGVKRQVMRSFAMVKMTDIQEVPVEY